MNSVKEDGIESVFIEINMPFSKNIIVGTIYRPPNKKVEVFENAMNVLLHKIDKENKICYLMGDFNIDLLKSESCDYGNRFIEQLFTSSFVPFITKPTRITEHTATIIDNIFTNNIEKVENSINLMELYSLISPIIYQYYTCLIKKIPKKTVPNTTTYETNFPLRQKHLKNNNNQGKSPWMTRCLIKSVMRKIKISCIKLSYETQVKKTKLNIKSIKIN